MGRLFEEIRQSVTAEDAARFYGLNVTERGKAFCPWHADHHPSLSFDRRSGRCKCFACNMGGDAVDIAAVLLDLSPLEAAQRINEDFNLQIDETPGRPALKGETPAQAARREREALAAEYSTTCDLLHIAQEILDQYTPESAENPAFTRILSIRNRLQDSADALLEVLNYTR